MQTRELSIDAVLVQILKCDTPFEICTVIEQMEEHHREGKLDIQPSDWPKITACVHRRRSTLIMS